MHTRARCGAAGALQSYVEPARAPARCRLRAGEPGLALRQGPLRLRVGALARTACVEPHGARERRAASRCRGRRRSTPRPPALRGALDARRSRLDRACSAARAAPTKTPTCGPASPKGVLGTDNVDAQLGDGLPAEVVLGLPARRPSPTSTAPPRSCSLGPDLEEELPVLHLRVRRAAVELGVPLVDLAACRARIVGARDLRSPRTVAGRRARRRRARALISRARRRSSRPASWSCSAGRRWPSRPTVAMRAAERARRRCPTCASSPRCAAATCTARIDAGLAPGFLPGRVTLDAGREWFAEAWGGQLPAAQGLDAQGILEAAAAGKIEVLVLLGSDPRRRLPRCRPRAPRRSPASSIVIAVGAFLTGTSRGRRSGAAADALAARRPAASRISKAACSGVEPQGRARGRRDGRLAHRGRARAPARHRVRSRDRRRAHRRDRPRRAGARRRRPPRC